VKYSKWFREEF